MFICYNSHRLLNQTTQPNHYQPNPTTLHQPTMVHPGYAVTQALMACVLLPLAVLYALQVLNDRSASYPGSFQVLVFWDTSG